MMTMRHMQVKTGLLPRAGALFAFALLLAPFAAGAQEYTDTRSMQNRIKQLENQIQTLSRSVYKGAPLPTDTAVSGGGADSSAALGVFGDRLQAIEQQQRTMTGQIEKLEFDVRQMQDQLQKFQADTEMRFQQAPASAASTSSTVTTPPARQTLPSDEMTATPPASVPSTDAAVRSSGNSTSGTLGTLSSSGSATAESLYESGFSDIRESNFDAAQKKFADFMSRYPTHALAANAQYWLAETHYVRGDYRQAAKLFAKGYQDYPQGQKAADCLLKLGLSLAKLGQKEDACLSLQQLQSEFPGDTSPVNRRAKQEMSQLGCG